MGATPAAPPPLDDRLTTLVRMRKRSFAIPGFPWTITSGLVVAVFLVLLADQVCCDKGDNSGFTTLANVKEQSTAFDLFDKTTESVLQDSTARATTDVPYTANSSFTSLNLNGTYSVEKDDEHGANNTQDDYDDDGNLKIEEEPSGVDPVIYLVPVLVIVITIISVAMCVYRRKQPWPCDDSDDYPYHATRTSVDQNYVVTWQRDSSK